MGRSWKSTKNTGNYILIITEMKDLFIGEGNRNIPWGIDKGDLSAAILHEVKNRFVVLSGLLSTIPSAHIPEHDTPLHAAQALAQWVSGLIAQALIVYRAETSGHMYLNAINSYSPQEFVRELAMEAIILSHGRLSITAAASDDFPWVWYFDRNLLELAIMNAIHNCLKYAKRSIHLELSIEDEMLKLTVSDDSWGYPLHILQSDMNDVKDVSAGTGLGLRFAHMIAKAHTDKGRSGFIRLRNEIGEWGITRACFEILIP